MVKASKFSQSVEDYLKAIYELTLDQDSTSTNEIAARLSVSAASVTSMLQKLAAQEPPLADYHKHHGASLTDAGRNVALRTIRQHRLLEMFLVKMLGYSWDEVHEEAERLEHAISPRFEERMAIALGEPLYDPHGDPIPRQDLSIPETRYSRLSEMEPGQQGTVRRILSSDAGLLKYLGELNIRPGSQVELIELGPFDHTAHIFIGDERERRVLGPDLGKKIMVETE